MDNFKFTIFTILILAVVIFVGYWAFSTIESGSDHLNNQELRDLKQENEFLKEQNQNLQEQIEKLAEQFAVQDSIDDETSDSASQNNETKEQTTQNTQPTETKAPSKYQTLINEIQKLIDDKVTMKRGSQGTRVGTVQKFLNVYNNTSSKIDNDFGAGTETAIKKFQGDQGLTADGEAGPGTFRKMIDWLNKQ